MEIPTLSDYLAATSAELRVVQERIVGACVEAIRNSSSFEQMSARIGASVSTLRAAGYPLRLMDEDGESMVCYGATFATSRALTLYGYWDDDQGPSVGCTFQDHGTTTALAGSPAAGIVALERR